MRCLLLALSLLIAVDAYAVTEVTRYVNGNCDVEGDGTGTICANDPGDPGTAHMNLCYAIEAERAIGVNFVSRDVNVTINLTNGASPDTCENSGSASLSAHTVVPYPGGGSSGTFIKDATHNFTFQGDPSDPYVVEYALFITAGNYNTWRYFNILANGAPATAIIATNGSIIESNIIHCDELGGGGGTATIGVDINNSSGFRESRVVNNVIYNCDYNIRVTSQIGSALDYVRIGLYNNTLVDAGIYNIFVYTCGSIPFPDCGRCSETTTTLSALFLANNLMQGAGTADFFYSSSCNDLDHCCFFSLGANATSDATSPDGATFQNQTATFTNAAGRDYTLAGNDQACLYRATDLRLDDFYPFSNDFQGDTRQNYWSCGGDNGTPNPKRRWGLTQGVDRLNEP